MSKEKPLVSVIIPVYNCEEYLERCLDSVYAQTLTDYEVIAVNDGSTDSSLNILKKYNKKYNNFTLIDQTNHGQGYARNRALEKAKGEYVTFVDSDDFIESLTLELATTRAENDRSDIVHYDWKLSSLLPERPDTYLYYNFEPFAHKSVLEGAECDEFLRMTNYFSVNNLYRKSFLNKHKIRYGEGYIYEDNIFMALVANRAEKISIIHSPLYIVQRNLSSTTQSNLTSDKHYKSFLRSVRESFEMLNPRTPYSVYYLVKYFQTKFIVYYKKRVPAKYRMDFIKGYVDIMHDLDIAIPSGDNPERIMRLCLDYDVFKKKKYALFRSLIIYKTEILPRRDALKKGLKKVKASARPQTYHQTQQKLAKLDGSILFLGFDYRYTGNSRYLFEELINDERFKDRDIRFITNDETLDDKYRISVDTDDYFKWIARAEIIVAESWIPGYIKKRSDAIWIQLWHGSTVKRVLFDSHEAPITRLRNGNKINKYRNVLTWDFLLADSKKIGKKFQSAFLFPKERILNAGYPRVKFLINNKGNKDLKRAIKEKIGLDDTLSKKKLVLYAPTWRDYNYGKPAEDHDFSYILDLETLSKELGDEYLILFHDHHFLSQKAGALNKQCLDVSAYEMQELLLVADYLVTDYSSVLFDAFPIDLPVVVYANDADAYESARGVYPDVWHDLEPFTTDTVQGVARKIEKYKVNESYKKFKKEYCYESDISLTDFLAAVKLEKLNRKW